MGYAWKRGVSIVGVKVKIGADIVQAIDNYGRRDFWYKKALSKPQKVDKESEEWIS